MNFTENMQGKKRENLFNALMKAFRDVTRLIINEKNRDHLIQGVCESLAATGSFKNAWIALTDSFGKLINSVCEETASFCAKLEHDKILYGMLTASVSQKSAFDEKEQALLHEIADVIAFGLYNIERE